MKFTIQQCKPEDNDEVKKFLLAILEGEFGHNSIDRPDLENICYFYQTGGGNFWIARAEQVVIGTVGLKIYQDVAFVKRMAVSKGFRGTGMANKLLSKVETYAKTLGHRELYLSTSPNLIAANRFYEKEGFLRIDKLPDIVPQQISTIHFVKEI